AEDRERADEDGEIDDRADDEEGRVEIRPRMLDRVRLERVVRQCRSVPRVEVGQAEEDRDEEHRQRDEDEGERLRAPAEDEDPPAARRVADEDEDERAARGGEHVRVREEVREERLLGVDDEADDRRDRADDAGDERDADALRGHGAPPRCFWASSRTGAGRSASLVPLASWSARM